jgi:hypothetical protein
VAAEQALDHIAGAMPFNDVSARDLQLQNPLRTSGKAVDTFAPCGPALVTIDEIDDLQALGLRTRINGDVVQEGNTAEMIFGVAETVAWLSRTMTLLPGDIIATGTPAGVGGPKGLFLRDGDTVSVEVDGLGAVTNRVRAESACGAAVPGRGPGQVHRRRARRRARRPRSQASRTRSAAGLAAVAIGACATQIRLHNPTSEARAAVLALLLAPGALVLQLATA